MCPKVIDQLHLLKFSICQALSKASRQPTYHMSFDPQSNFQIDVNCNLQLNKTQFRYWYWRLESYRTEVLKELRRENSVLSFL